MRRSNSYFPLILGGIILFSCNHTAETPSNVQPAEKPVSSLAYIVYQRGNIPFITDSMQFFYDSVTKAFRQVVRPNLGYYYRPGNPVFQGSAEVETAKFEDYEFYFDVAGRPKSGVRTSLLQPAQSPTQGGAGPITANDSIRYSVNSLNQVVGVTFYNRKIISIPNTYPVKPDTTFSQGVLDTYTISYDTAGSVSKIHLEKSSTEKWDVEFSYGSNKAPMLTPVNTMLTPCYILYRRYSWSDLRMALSMLQARHEITKIKATNLLTGLGYETTFSWTFRPDGYPDIATVNETAAAADPNYLTWSSYNLKFVYNR